MASTNPIKDTPGYKTDVAYPSLDNMLSTFDPQLIKGDQDKIKNIALEKAIEDNRSKVEQGAFEIQDQYAKQRKKQNRKGKGDSGSFGSKFHKAEESRHTWSLVVKIVSICLIVIGAVRTLFDLFYLLDYLFFAGQNEKVHVNSGSGVEYTSMTESLLKALNLVVNLLIMVQGFIGFRAAYSENKDSVKRLIKISIAFVVIE